RANTDTAALPADVDRGLLDNTMLVVDPDRPSRRWTRAGAVAEVLAALPFGRLWSWPLRLPGVSALANAAYDAFARNRTRISTWLGLAACGVPNAPRPVEETPPQPTPLPACSRAPPPLAPRPSLAFG